MAQLFPNETTLCANLCQPFSKKDHREEKGEGKITGRGPYPAVRGARKAREHNRKIGWHRLARWHRQGKPEGAAK